MRIAFFTDSYLPQPDGVATSVDACVEALERRGHEVHIIAPKYPRFKDTRENVVRLRSVKVSTDIEVRLGLQIPPRSLLRLAREDFDVIHGHAGGPITFLGWQIARMRNLPYVYTYHTLWSRYVHYVFNGKIIKPRVMEISSRIFGNACDCIIAPTVRVKKELSSYGITQPMHCIPTGIDCTVFAHGKKGELRQRIGVSKDKKILLYVGRLGKEKSVDFVIKAFAHIHKSDPNTVLALVGKGAQKRDLMLLVEKLHLESAVFFVGGIDHSEIQDMYADADVFLFASKTETQGLVILESFASGVPVVVVKDPAYEGIVINNSNGFVTNKNVTDFSKAALHLLRDKNLRDTFGKEARLTAEKFSTEMMAEKLEEVYIQVVIDHAKNIKWWRKRIKNIANFLSI